MKKTVADRTAKALIELMKTKDISEISVKELIQKAGISRSSYNYNFHSIDDVLDAIFENFGKELEESIKGKPFEPGDHRHHFVIKYVLLTLENNKEIVRVLLASGYKTRLYKLIYNKCMTLAKSHKLPYLNEHGKKTTYQDKDIYDLTIAEICSSMIARVEYYLSYDFELSINDALKVFRAVNKYKEDTREYANKNLVEYWGKFNY